MQLLTNDSVFARLAAALALISRAMEDEHPSNRKSCGETMLSWIDPADKDRFYSHFEHRIDPMDIAVIGMGLLALYSDWDDVKEILTDLEWITISAELLYLKITRHTFRTNEPVSWQNDLISSPATPKRDFPGLSNEEHLYVLAVNDAAPDTFFSSCGSSKLGHPYHHQLIRVIRHARNNENEYEYPTKDGWKTLEDNTPHSAIPCFCGSHLKHRE